MDGHFSNEEGKKSKSKEAQRCSEWSEKRKKKEKREKEKAVRWEGWERGRGKDGRLVQVSVDHPGTSDTSSLRLTLVQQLVLSQPLNCLPQHLSSWQYHCLT